MTTVGIFARRGRSGLTIVELVVAIAICTLLMSLIAAGVMHVRESARRVTCQARLHEIGIASAAYETRTGSYPRGPREFYNSLAWFGFLLADIGQPELQRECYERANDGRSLQLFWRSNSVPNFQCPSDPGSVLRWNTSYSINCGSELGSYEEDYPDLPHTHGIRGGPIAAKDVPDGLSNTAHVAERLSVLPSTQDRRARWKTPVAYLEPGELDLFADLCSTMPTNAIGLGPWNSREIIDICTYDHVMAPNQPSCLNENWNYGYSTYAASSEHTGGVNVLFADGSVRFVSNSVARRVWRAMGTRDGSEAISME